MRLFPSKKGWIFDQPVTQAGGLLLKGGVGVGITKGLKGSRQGGLQQAFVPNALQSSAL